jgi:adenylosuccinate lyase
MTTNSQNDTYTSPLASRNASPEMLRIWSPRHKFNTWRRIWLAVAEAQHEVTKGWDTPLVSQEQLDELRAVVERGITDEEIARAAELERDLRHDVMAHVHCLGEQCPKAKGIIHLGCTSQDVVCNADLWILGQAKWLISEKRGRVTWALGLQADVWKQIPTLGFTHYQAAQPTTVGRRLAGYAYEIDLIDGCVMDFTGSGIGFRGLRGATGTQASFLKLMGDDSELVDKLEEKFCASFSYGAQEDSNIFSELTATGAWLQLVGQTYPRVIDTFLLSECASTAAVLHKIATDIRLLSNRKEIDEPFGDKQIGSSAMPYKRNPMKCERICGLSRFVMNLVGNAYDTAATQWLERTLDDSSNRRLSLPEAFLALDGHGPQEPDGRIALPGHREHPDGGRQARRRSAGAAREDPRPRPGGGHEGEAGGVGERPHRAIAGGRRVQARAPPADRGPVARPDEVRRAKRRADRAVPEGSRRAAQGAVWGRAGEAWGERSGGVIVSIGRVVAKG